ncbi:hypothetical protein C7271_09295 [filamentous cyanobacterium CCP5]|nr:hypothetical protein C7271_09295 [filamentous cyanobacterium CCP5]
MGINQEAYHQLHLTAGLSLRRQLFFAVCDDIVLQGQLAYQLDADYGDEEAAASSSTTIVTFWIDPQQPSPLRPILDWLKHHRLQGKSSEVPLFQVLGIDRLTQQSPAVQNQFLASLSRLELLLTRVDMSLLLWLPRPWLQKLKRGVPGFWRMRSRLFEFAGEPSPSAVEHDADRLWIRSVRDLNRPDPPPELSGPPPAEISAANPLSVLWTMLEDAGRSMGVEMAPPDLPVPLILAPPGAVPESASLSSESAEAVSEVCHRYAELEAHWQQIQVLNQQQAGPLTLAQLYLGLGQLCRDRVEAGDSSPELLDLAITAYRQSLLTLPLNSPDRCDSLNDLGSLYWLRSQTETRGDAMVPWLEQSTEAYCQALQVPDALLNPDAIARINANLGAAYGLLAGLTDSVVNLKRAVQAYQQAIAVRPAATHSLEYASLQNSLGSVHWQLSQLEADADHLRQAILAYSEALQYRSPEADPADFAMVQNNLGIAYWSLSQHEQPGYLLEQSIQAYQIALEFRQVTTDPAGCAATCNNLGTAYWDLAQHHSQHPDQQLAYWRQSVAAYEAALEAAQQAQGVGLALNFDVWATFHSAGVVHDHIAQRLPEPLADERSHHLQRALALYLQALVGWRNDSHRLSLLTDSLAHNVRSHFEILGMAGQQQALSQVPPELLPDIMAQV